MAVSMARVNFLTDHRTHASPKKIKTHAANDHWKSADRPFACNHRVPQAGFFRTLCQFLLIAGKL